MQENEQKAIAEEQKRRTIEKILGNVSLFLSNISVVETSK